MIPIGECKEIPEWLINLENVNMLPIQDVLNRSLFYPSSGRDGDPVRYLAGLVHSFVYVDYGFDRDDIWASIHDSRHGFKGYSLFGCRELSEKELTPQGWQPIFPDPRRDGNPEKYKDYIKQPFGIWAVFGRDPLHTEEHGPKRFSLLYIRADGAAAFQALYHGNKTKPEVVAIIQPGTGFGCNWTDFRDPNLIFGRSVIQNPYGKPRYLVYGGYGTGYQNTCWPEYSNRVHYWKTNDGELGLWSRYQSEEE